MAPCRQLLMWSVPSLAVLLGIYWIRKKREYTKADSGGREKIKSLKEELAEALNAECEAKKCSPYNKSDYSIVKSAPIDIVPNGNSSQRSSPLVLTDEEIDLEIEKMKKKSLEREKKMPKSFEYNKVIVNSGSSQSFIVKYSPSQNSFTSEMDTVYKKSETSDSVYNKSISSRNELTDSETNKSVSCKSEETTDSEYNKSVSSKSDVADSEIIKSVSSKTELTDLSCANELTGAEIIDSEINHLGAITVYKSAENGVKEEFVNLAKPDCSEIEIDVSGKSPLVDNNELNSHCNHMEPDTEQSNNINIDIANNRISSEQSRRISERDSANHSPVDPLLASPSMCHFSDNHSEGSSDSGKGCSEAASPPPANIVPAETGLRIHQFLIPQTLVGLLIGKHGSFVTQIKAKTGATVYVRRHPDSAKQKICAVEGTQSEIEAALDLIKEKFPEKRFPNFSMQEISAELYQRLVPLVPEFLQLVESVNNDTIMTCLVSAGHFFLQQPLHPTFPSLHALHRLMAATYQNPDVPSLPLPVKEGSICAAPTENNWYRAQVISTSEENNTSVVKLVDFGGYLTVDNDQLKQIRSDFMTLPFQATEALLAFVKPANNESEWSGEALRIMAGLTAGQLLHAQVAGYDEAGLPLVHLYLTLHPQQVIFLNRELVERGLAEWDIPQDS